MKKTIKIISLITLCVIIAVGSSFVFIGRAEGGNETNSFVKDYYIGATNQKSPFFDKILPEIAKNIKENNQKTHLKG